MVPVFCEYYARLTSEEVEVSQEVSIPCLNQPEITRKHMVRHSTWLYNETTQS